MSNGLYLNSRYGRGHNTGNFLPVGKQAARVANFNRANNINNIIEERKNVKIHSRALLIVDKSFQARYLPLLSHLIDIGYISNSIDTKVIEDDIVSIEAAINEYYNNGGRLFFGAQNSKTFFDLRPWFELHSDALYFNSGSRIYTTQIDDLIPDNMITTSCNHYRMVQFIFDNIICNIHKHADFLNGSVFDNIFDFVDDSLPNGQAFNQIVYVCDNSELQTKNNFIDVIKNYIQTNFSQDTFYKDPVTLQTFTLNITKDTAFPNALDILLTENPINSSKFSQSNVKSIFIFDCFNSENCQTILDLFSKKEYTNNLIIFNEKFLNLNIANNLPFYTNFEFSYSFILAVNYSELGYKTSKHIFNDYSTPLPFIDIFSHILNIFNRVVSANVLTPVNRLVEYLTNSFSIDRNEWHVKPLYLYGLKERYNENTSVWDFYSSATIFKKSFNDTNTGTASTNESWIDTAISGYPSAPGNTTYSSNSNAYSSSNTNFLNSNLNGVSMLFSSMQEITDYTSDLDGFFNGSYKSSTYNGGKNPNSTPTIFGIWKMLINSTWKLNSTSVSPITIDVTVPSEAVIDGTSTNKNYWLYINSGLISYKYTSYNSSGAVISTTNSDSVTIDLDMTYSASNYIVFFNKGNSYNGIRGPLVINFNLFANQVVNKQYRIGDVISISSDPVLGKNVNASINSISSDGFTFGVTRFENENSNGITSSILKQNSGIIMSLANDSSNVYMYVNPDISNVSNNGLNLWSPNGCYYMALLPNGTLVANDYRTGITFWSSGSGFSNPGPASLRFRILESTVSNPFPQPPTTTYYIELHLLDTTGAERVKILKQSVNLASLIYPLQLVVTNDRNISIINATGQTLWSEATNIYLNLTNGNTIPNSNNDYKSLYSLSGIYNLALALDGSLNFTNVTSKKVIYSVNNTTATYLKFSYTINSANAATFTLGLYNSSNTLVYDILKDGTLQSSTTFDVINNKLANVSFVSPYTFKISNNGDLIIVDANNNICWALGKADTSTVTQDLYEMDSTGAPADPQSEITGISSVHPRHGDYVTVHNPVNPQYSGATATISLVNNDKSIKAIFYDENDSTTRSNIIEEKPDLRPSLVTDSGVTTGQNFMPVSNTELFNLTSDNGYYTANISENGIVNVVDNRTERVNWSSPPLEIPSGQNLLKCNGLKLDNDNGSLYVDILLSNNTTEKYYIFNNTDISNNSTISSYSLNMQDDGNLCLYQLNTNGTQQFLWGSGTWQTESWTSTDASFQAYQYNLQNAPPRLISTNGNFYLAMDQGKLGVMSYINGSYKWIDYNKFGYIGKPFFYSGQSGVTATTTSGAAKTVYNCGTLWQNYSNSNTGGYWSKIYSNVDASFSFSNADSTTLVDSVNVIWVSSDATTNKNTPSGSYNFSYTYNNTTGKTIRSTLWVSVLEQCDIYISTISAVSTGKPITTVGSGSSSSWNNLWTYDFDLQPGSTTFTFYNTHNGGGRCGLAFICFPKYISSCDLYLNNTSGNLMTQNVQILATNNTTVFVPGISNLPAYAITNLYGTSTQSPYKLAFEDDGVGGSDGTLTITNSTGSTLLSTTADPNGDIDLSLFVPTDRNGILNAGIKLYAQQDENELESFLWSPSAYSFFGITVDTSSQTQTVCIFDARFTKPVYTFYTSKYTTLTSADAISYLMLTTSGQINVYNIYGTILYNITSTITGYSNFSLKLDDSNVLYILSNNNVVASLPYNHTWGTFENYILSSGTIEYKNGRILTSSNGNYTLTLDNGSLNINSVTDTSYTNSSGNTTVTKNIYTTTQYANLYAYIGSDPSNAYLTFDASGVLKVHDSTGIKYTFGTPNIGIPGYKLILGNTGELAIYDCSIPAAQAIDSGSINDCSNWSNVYNKFKGNTSSYAWNNYRWLWNTANSKSGAAPNTTVNFYTTYTNSGTTDINATLWCSADDYLTIYMNDSPFALPNTITQWNSIISNAITLKPGTSFFKFVATNSGGKSPNPAGLIFWCLNNGDTNDATNTLFFSNPETVYCSDGIIIGPSDFGIQTWSSGTSYSETVPYPNYTIDTSDIPENQIINIEYNFKIPSSSDDTEEYTKIYSQNRLYYLRLEIDGSLSIYLSSSNKRIWSNRRPYSGPNTPARIGFSNGKFGLWDSKGQSYGNTISISSQHLYVFYLGNDRVLRLVGSDGSSTIFNP